MRLRKRVASPPSALANSAGTSSLAASDRNSGLVQRRPSCGRAPQAEGPRSDAAPSNLKRGMRERLESCSSSSACTSREIRSRMAARSSPPTAPQSRRSAPPPRSAASSESAERMPPPLSGARSPARAASEKDASAMATPTARRPTYASGSAAAVADGAASACLAARILRTSPLGALCASPLSGAAADESKSTDAARPYCTRVSPQGMSGHSASLARICSAAGPPKDTMRSIDAQSLRSQAIGAASCQPVTLGRPFHTGGSIASTASAAEKAPTSSPSRTGHSRRAQLGGAPSSR
jgi:hypothetical protein